ncbi:N-acetylmuramoyl-L-alanine amidase [Ammoniphilus resinae]|uniref:N-acetylmuramoyl-L-alanine amidase n=1 Tax=Ammoniphilus resinae TaxID=861532 RepID=A0ABS4GJN2_9BACL|nr:N-acetylmuramoyl-L-alanine amidase [Ammoniphilus resinae]MBP1930451.1 N-acetylmuramoyl-L-alanine amidase [Ammoniphilus resinae]
MSQLPQLPFFRMWIPILFILVFLFSPTLPMLTVSSEGKQTASVTVSTLNVREEPGLNYPIVGEVHQGESYQISDMRDDWIEIIFDQGKKGWVASWLVEIQVEAEEKNNTALYKISPTIEALNVRSGPSTSFSTVAQLSQEKSYLALEEQGDWIKIKFSEDSSGWVAGWLVKKDKDSNSQVHTSSQGFIKILSTGTNIRSGADTSFPVVHIAQEGERFPVLEQVGDWFKIRLTTQETAFVAGWIVAAEGLPNVSRKEIGDLLKGKTIIIDPGHGGSDSGAIGPHLGTLEKIINLEVSQLLTNHLKEAGAKVILTRQDDRKLSLQSRVDASIIHQADVFISLHHNTSENYRVNGLITYFYSDGEDKKLAEQIQESLVKHTGLTDLNARFGDYFVLRENPQLAVLCELGFLTNYQEEIQLNTKEYQRNAAEGIFQGVIRYFKDK